MMVDKLVHARALYTLHDWKVDRSLFRFLPRDIDDFECKQDAARVIGSSGSRGKRVFTCHFSWLLYGQSLKCIEIVLGD
jgi:hypothetical protein